MRASPSWRRVRERGDGDPLDICVISERPIERSEVILRARVIGGIKLLDRGEADDKIIGVLEGDYVWDHVKDISQLAPVLVERLEHYFSTYKMVPGEPNKMVISGQVRLRARQGGDRSGERGLRRNVRRSHAGTAPNLRTRSLRRRMKRIMAAASSAAEGATNQ